jgi:spore germination protein
MFGFFKEKTAKQVLDSNEPHEFAIEIFTNVDDNLKNIKQMLDSPDDLITRKFTIGNTSHSSAVVFIDGLVDKDMVNDKVIRNIQLGLSGTDKEIPSAGKEILTELENEVLSISEITTANSLDQVTLAVLSGDTALFIDGTDYVLLIGTKGWASRGVEEPITESVVRGPRDGFTENLRTNTVLVRRRVRDPNLRFKTYQIGRRSKRDLILAYVDGIIHPDLVTEVKRRLASIDIADAPETGIIEQWIEDSFLSPFPQHTATERPDKVASSLLQGKFAIFLDGTPFVIVAPQTFAGHFQSPGDYYERFPIGTFIRVLRYIAAFFATFLPALYIALVSYHPGMVPSKLAFQIAGTREGVPFPAVVEAIIMEATLELLREAGIRLPKMIGQTIGIVGGLIIGEAAVSAGIVSPIMVIVVAVTAISSFAMPSYSVGISFRLLRFAIM